MSGDGACCQPRSPHAETSEARCSAAWPVRRGCSIRDCASHHRQMTGPGLLSSGSGQHCWEAAAGHRKGSIWAKGQLQEGCLCIAVPTASSSPARLVPASPSPHQSGLELQRPGWHRQQHQKAAAAAAPPPGPREETSQPLGRAGCPLPAYGTAIRQTRPGHSPKREPVLSCPRQSSGDAPAASGPACVCVTADTAEAMRPLLPPAPTPSGIPLRDPALLARGLAGCRRKIPHWDT